MRYSLSKLKFWALVGLLSLSLGSSPLLAKSVVIDKIIAVIDKEVLTASEFLAEARIALVLREGPAALNLPLEPAILNDLLNYVIEQTMLAVQVRRSGESDIAENEVQKRVAKLEAKFPTFAEYSAFLQRVGIKEEKVWWMMRRDLANERYLAKHLRMRLMVMGGSTLTPTPVSKEQEQIVIKRFLKELRANVEVRLLSVQNTLELANG